MVKMNPTVGESITNALGVFTNPTCLISNNPEPSLALSLVTQTISTVNATTELIKLGLTAFVEEAEEELINAHLITSRVYNDKSGIRQNEGSRLTELGIKLNEQMILS